MYHYALVYELMLSARSRHVNTMHLACTARSLARAAMMKWQQLHARTCACAQTQECHSAQKDAEGFCERVLKGKRGTQKV